MLLNRASPLIKTELVESAGRHVDFGKYKFKFNWGWVQNALPIMANRTEKNLTFFFKAKADVILVLTSVCRCVMAWKWPRMGYGRHHNGQSGQDWVMRESFQQMKSVDCVVVKICAFLCVCVICHLWVFGFRVEIDVLCSKFSFFVVLWVLHCRNVPCTCNPCTLQLARDYGGNTIIIPTITVN